MTTQISGNIAKSGWTTRTATTRLHALQINQPFEKATTLNPNATETDGALNGCVKKVEGFLRELAGLTGQASHGVPVLELQLGEIMTTTSVETTGKNYLLITALLPKLRRAQQLGLPPAAPTGPAAAGAIEFLWHADLGRYIGVRKVPVIDLPDERSLMDAILETSDQATAWFTTIRSNKNGASNEPRRAPR